MILQQNLQEVGSEWPCSNPTSYLRLGTVLTDFLVVLVGSFLATVLIEALPDFFAAFAALDFSLFSAALDLLLCECFTGVM